MPDRAALSPPVPAWRVPMRVAYVVSHSIPYSSNGYAERSHEIARALAGHGHDVVVINRPGRPWDIEGFAPGGRVAAEQIVDGVRYVFLPTRAQPAMPTGARLKHATAALQEAFGVFRPSVVLAASNWENAEPAQNAARQLGVPFFYEMRGFWELSRAEAEPGKDANASLERARRFENRIAREAEAVFTLGETMREALIARDLPGSRIHLVRNGVSAPRPVQDPMTRADIGCTARHLIGYVGSLSDYEGVQDLLHVTARLRAGGCDAALMIVGSSAPKGVIATRGAGQGLESGLKALAAELSISPYVHFVARVAADRVAGYYGICDAVVMARRRTPVTDLVPPLKPYTAVAHGVPVFMSDLAPLREIATEIDATLFAEGDLDGLSDLLRERLERDPPADPPVPDPGLSWHHRVEEMSRLMRQAADAGAGALGLPGGGLLPGGGAGQFDPNDLPGVFLHTRLGEAPLACLGPGGGLGDAPVVHLTRQNILTRLATGPVGTFVIDWAGLKDAPGEWLGLWSVDNMRLNRLVMDACRIGLARGWHMQVRGPVNRSQAPLFRSVSAVLEEVAAAADGTGAAGDAA